jgi:hypothetical protein
MLRDAGTGSADIVVTGQHGGGAVPVSPERCGTLSRRDDVEANA